MGRRLEFNGRVSFDIVEHITFDLIDRGPAEPDISERQLGYLSRLLAQYQASNLVGAEIDKLGMRQASHLLDQFEALEVDFENRRRRLLRQLRQSSDFYDPGAQIEVPAEIARRAEAFQPKPEGRIVRALDRFVTGLFVAALACLGLLLLWIWIGRML